MIAVVLARGLGQRMRQEDAAAVLEPRQRAAAEAGHKGLMPVGDGRPFLDYLLGSLADAGCRDVVLVVAPDHDAFATRYGQPGSSRTRVRFAVQDEPLGTAHAVLAAAPLVGDEPFLALNADNVYPRAVLRDLIALDGPGLPGFTRQRLVEESGFPADRVAQFALVETDGSGWLRAIREKPGAAVLDAIGPDALISMNVWRFDRRIFDACRAVPRSARGEYELPEAVGVALDQGVQFRVVAAHGAVIDLSSRADVARVGAQLAGLEAVP